MTTETPGLHRMEFNEQNNYEKYDQIEKKIFNTGPQASKTFPTQIVSS